jgi:hypothetical protein
VKDIIMDRRIAALLIVIIILAIGVGFGVYTHSNPMKNTAIKNTTTKSTPIKNKPVKNSAIAEDTTSHVESGQYGYCAICGKALTYEEAHDEYTQGKVCQECAANPYFETHEGAEYANSKLLEAYPDEYSQTEDDADSLTRDNAQDESADDTDLPDVDTGADSLQDNTVDDLPQDDIIETDFDGKIENSNARQSET